jgi:hydrophobe/amphiphile efflux-3 (HAE3) family protein
MKFPSNWVMRFAWPIILTFVLGALAFAIPLKDIEIDPEIKNQLPENMPARLDVRAIEKRFGGSELVMIVVQADDVLASRTLTRIRTISERLSQVPHVDRVMSPFSLTDIRGTPDGMMAVEAAIAKIPETDADRAALKKRLAENPLVFGNVVSRDFKAMAIIGLLSAEAKDRETGENVQKLLRSVPGPETVLVGGMPEVRQNVSDDIRSDIRRFAPAGVFVMLAFLMISLRQIRGVLIPFSVQVLAIVVSMGLIPILGWKVQMVTVTLPVMLLAIGNDHTVHLVARYQEENVPGSGLSPVQIVTKVLSELGFPILTAGITTVAGFLCLLTHIVVPAAQLGVLAAVGLGFIMIAAITLAPAMMSKLPPGKPLKGAGDPEKAGMLDRILRSSAGSVLRHPKRAVAIFLGVSVVASAGLPLLKVDTNPINYYPESAPVATTARAINDHFGGSTEISVMVEGDIQDPKILKQLDRLESELRGMPQVGFTTSIAQVVRTMNRAIGAGEAGSDSIPDTREGVSQLFLLYSMGGSPQDFERLVDFEYKRALLTARVRSLSTGDIQEVVRRVRTFAEREMPGVKVTVGGFGAVFADLVDAIIDGQISSLVVSFVVVFLLNALGFWSLGAGAWSMIPLGVAVPALFGLMGTFGIELNVVTAMLSSIMIGVGVDYTVHFLWRYRDERREGLDAEEATMRALTTVGRGIVFNALAVVLGFSVLGLSNFLPVQFFGFLVVVSIAACMLAAMVLMPALVVWFDPKFARSAANAKPAVGGAVPETP